MYLTAPLCLGAHKCLAVFCICSFSLSSLQLSASYEILKCYLKKGWILRLEVSDSGWDSGDNRECILQELPLQAFLPLCFSWQGHAGFLKYQTWFAWWLETYVLRQWFSNKCCFLHSLPYNKFKVQTHGMETRGESSTLSFFFFFLSFTF